MIKITKNPDGTLTKTETTEAVTIINIDNLYRLVAERNAQMLLEIANRRREIDGYIRQITEAEDLGAAHTEEVAAIVTDVADEKAASVARIAEAEAKSAELAK